MFGFHEFTIAPANAETNIGRHPHRASHIHFTVKAQGYDELVRHLDHFCYAC